MDKQEYESLFKKRKRTKAALRQAWQNRAFEIELYWKRASYFWTFIAATFIGYFTLISSSSFKDNVKDYFPQIEYIIICLGFIFSFAWFLVNKGSKRWQENWENHIDALEDKITGPIYKTVTKELSYSVSGINLCTSGFVAAIWLLLGLKYSLLNIKLCCSGCRFDLIWTLMTSMTVLLVLLLIVKTRRTNNKDKEVEFILRNVAFKKNTAR